MAEGFPLRQVYGQQKTRIGVERLKWLTQTPKQGARQLEIRGLEPFREAVVDESQRMPGLTALAVFAEQAGQRHRRPQLPGERRLRARDGERFGEQFIADSRSCRATRICDLI